MATLSTKMLAAVALNYGDDSTEYSMAGGVRTSDRKKATRKSNAAKNNVTNAQKTNQNIDLVTI